jgi:hypothetical protein
MPDHIQRSSTVPDPKPPMPPVPEPQPWPPDPFPPKPEPEPIPTQLGSFNLQLRSAVRMPDNA